MKIRLGSKPKTTFKDERNAINVKLISWPDVESTKRMIINVCYGYDDPNIYDSLTEEEREQAIKDVVAGGTLPKALEMCGKFVFLVENISLTITHMLVRHRFFTILQRSTAVADIRDENFVMPRSFNRDREYYEKVKQWYLHGKELYCEGVDKQGLSVQDARLLIPKNNCNHMFIGADLKALREAYSQRVCSQEEPIPSNIVFKEIEKLVVEKFPYLNSMFRSGCDSGHCLHCKPGKHSNVVFKRNELHSRFLPEGYLNDNPDELLHDKTRDEMNDGPEIVEETI